MPCVEMTLESAQPMIEDGEWMNRSTSFRVHATENVIGKHELDLPLNVSLRGDHVAGPD